MRRPVQVRRAIHRRLSVLLGLLAGLTALLVGCGSASRPPIPTVPRVDLARYMGDWYVIGVIPTAIERQAYNAVESYRLNPDGTIATTFRFREGAFDGPQKVYHPKGFVVDEVNHSTWGMRFVWPFKAEYLIADLDPDYTETIVARTARDYVWIMARTPTIPDDDYDRLRARVIELGYDPSKLRKVPQRW